jgi:hypothetical protein
MGTWRGEVRRGQRWVFGVDRQLIRGEIKDISVCTTMSEKGEEVKVSGGVVSKALHQTDSGCISPNTANDISEGTRTYSNDKSA